MGVTEDFFSLRLWSLATFHTVSFVTVVVLSFHRGGSLQRTLANLDTAKGFGLFLLLWIATWIATRIGVRCAQSDGETPATIVAAAVVGGGWNGVFVLAATLVFAGAFLNPAVLLFSIVGGLIAFVVGGTVGFLYGLLDAVLLGVSAALFEWATDR